jgi:hypothetical protein
MIGYLIAQHLRLNVYMPVFNPEQKRFILQKEYFGETNLARKLEDALTVKRIIDSGTGKSVSIIECNVNSFIKRDDKLIVAFSFIPFKIVAEGNTLEKINY